MWGIGVAPERESARFDPFGGTGGMMKLSGTRRRRAIDRDAGQDEMNSPADSDEILSIPPAGGQDLVRPSALSDGGNALTTDIG